MDAEIKEVSHERYLDSIGREGNPLLVPKRTWDVSNQGG